MPKPPVKAIAPAPAPPSAPILQPGSIVPAAGTMIGVPMANATGEPGAAVVAVTVEPWFKSRALWAAAGGFLLSAGDAIVNVLLPIFTSTDPVHWDKLPRPIIVAIILTYMAKRHLQQNSVVGSGK